jgi:hypothetical protein
MGSSVTDILGAAEALAPAVIGAAIGSQIRGNGSQSKGENDYDVLADGLVVGRIVKAAASPAGKPWMWTLLFGYYDDRTPRRARRRWQHSQSPGGGGDARINRAVQKMQPRND